MSLALSVADVAPLYNLGLVVIAIYLFAKLFRTPLHDKRVYLTPWKLLFVGLCIFILEEVITILRSAGIVTITRHINGFFELAMIALFILLKVEFIV